MVGTSATPPSVSSDSAAADKTARELSAQLNELVYDYYAHAPNSDEVDASFLKIKDFLAAHQNEPRFILQVPVSTGDTHADSHFLQALYLPFGKLAGQCSRELATEKAYILFNLFAEFSHSALKHEKISAEEYSSLLATCNNHGFSVLQQTALSLHPKLAALVFNEVKEHLHQPDYAKLLAHKSGDKFTVLQSAVVQSTGLQSARASQSIKYLRFLFDEIRNGLHDEERYTELFSFTNEEKFSLLHSAVLTHNLDIMRLVFDEAGKHLTKTAYANLIPLSSHGEISLLHSALLSGDVNKVRFVFKEVEKNLPEKEYEKLLSKLTQKDFSLLHTATTINLDVARFVFKEIKDRLSSQSFADLFIHPTDEQFSLLHTAIHSKPELLPFILEQAAQLPKDNYADFFAVRTKQQGFDALQVAARSGKLKTARLVFEAAKNHLPPQRYSDLLTATTEDGFSLLHAAVSAGNVDVARFVFGEVRAALKEKDAEEKTWKTLLTAQTSSGWNLFHMATRMDVAKETPDPFMINFLHDEFYSSFGTKKAFANDEAKETIKKLYEQPNNNGFPAFNEGQVHNFQWYKKLMGLGYKDGALKPNPIIRG